MATLRIAHRGASGSAPENTLAAFRKAVDLGSDLVEMDLRSSLDGALMVLHDSSVDRTTDGSGKLAEMTLAEIRKLDAGSWFSQKYAGERIPTLEETLAAVRDQALLLIEAKEPGLEEALQDLLQRTGMFHEVVIQSFSSDIVSRIKALHPKLPCGLLMSSPPDPSSKGSDAAMAVVEAVLSCGANYAGLHGEMATAELVGCLRKRGIPVWVWTLDDPSHIQDAMTAGVAGIISNHPERIPA